MRNSNEIIWLSDCFKKFGNGFRQMPKLEITMELLKSLEKARGYKFTHEEMNKQYYKNDKK